MVADPILAGLIADVEAATARLARYVAGTKPVADPEQSGEAWPAYADHPDLIEVTVATERSRVSPGTIRRWCRDDGIGRKYGNDWYVSRKRLAERLER